MPKKDDKILSLNQRGFGEAQFTKIYEENFDRLYHFALTFTKSEDLAKDVVSEVFMSLWKNRDRFSEIRQLESYLYISIKNQSIHAISKNPNKVRMLDIELESKIIDKIDPEELLLEKELLIEIDKVVGQLPDQCQLIFRMAREKQLKYKEIADELGVSVSTVRMQLIKATSAIKETIRKKYNDEDDADILRLGMINLVLVSLLIIS